MWPNWRQTLTNVFLWKAFCLTTFSAHECLDIFREALQQLSLVVQQKTTQIRTVEPKYPDIPWESCHHPPTDSFFSGGEVALVGLVGQTSCLASRCFSSTLHRMALPTSTSHQYPPRAWVGGKLTNPKVGESRWLEPKWHNSQPPPGLPFSCQAEKFHFSFTTFHGSHATTHPRTHFSAVGRLPWLDWLARPPVWPAGAFQAPFIGWLCPHPPHCVLRKAQCISGR